MGVNLVALFPRAFDEQMLSVIGQLETGTFRWLEEEIRAVMKAEGFAVEEDAGPPQWYEPGPVQYYRGIALGSMQATAERPPLPNAQAELGLPIAGLMLKVSPDAFIVWSVVRANLAVKHYPAVGAKLLEAFRVVGRVFGATDALIMGDDNPIYHAFLRHEDFRAVADPEQPTFEALYVATPQEQTYDIIGHYRLRL